MATYPRCAAQTKAKFKQLRAQRSRHCASHGAVERGAAPGCLCTSDACHAHADEHPEYNTKQISDAAGDLRQKFDQLPSADRKAYTVRMPCTLPALHHCCINSGKLTRNERSCRCEPRTATRRAGRLNATTRQHQARTSAACTCCSGPAFRLPHAAP